VTQGELNKVRIILRPAPTTVLIHKILISSACVHAYTHTHTQIVIICGLDGPPMQLSLVEKKLKFKHSNYNNDERTMIVIKTAAVIVSMQTVFTELIVFLIS
jgi:hypothetical protein